MAYKRQQLDTRMDQLGYIPKAAFIAYEELLKTLKKEETILYLLEGSIKGSLGFVVATDLRVYYVGVNKYKMPFLAHIQYDDIVAIRTEESRISPSAELIVDTKKYGELRIKGAEPDAGKEFQELITLLTVPPVD